MSDTTRLTIALAVMAAIALMFAGYLVDTLAEENARLHLELALEKRRKKAGEPATILDGEFREKH